MKQDAKEKRREALKFGRDTEQIFEKAIMDRKYSHLLRAEKTSPPLVVANGAFRAGGKGPPDYLVTIRRYELGLGPTLAWIEVKGVRHLPGSDYRVNLGVVKDHQRKHLESSLAFDVPAMVLVRILPLADWGQTPPVMPESDRGGWWLIPIDRWTAGRGGKYLLPDELDERGVRCGSLYTPSRPASAQEMPNWPLAMRMLDNDHCPWRQRIWPGQ